MIVASTATAMAMPTPMLLIVMTSASANAAKTVTMIRAAPVMTPAVLDEALGDRRRVVAGPPIRLLDPREQQDLVVHRQPEDHAEHDDRVAGDGVAERLEVEQVREVALLEDPDEGPEAGGDREQGHDHGLDRDDDRAEQQEQDQRARDAGSARPRTGARSACETRKSWPAAALPPTCVVMPVAGIDRADDRDHVGRGRPRRRQRADRVEADGAAADVLRQQRVEARGGRWPVGQRVERRRPARASARAGLRVVDRERALDPVDAVDRGDRSPRSRSRACDVGRGRSGSPATSARMTIGVVSPGANSVWSAT